MFSRKKKSSPQAQIMFLAQSSLLDNTPRPFPHNAPSLLLSFAREVPHCNPHLGGRLGRFAEQSHFTSTRNTNPNPTVYSQERQQADTQHARTWKQERRDEPSNSASARRLERGEDIQMSRLEMDFRNMQISHYRHLEKVTKKTCERSWIARKIHKCLELQHWRPTY